MILSGYINADVDEIFYISTGDFTYTYTEYGLVNSFIKPKLNFHYVHYTYLNFHMDNCPAMKTFNLL